MMRFTAAFFVLLFALSLAGCNDDSSGKQTVTAKPKPIVKPVVSKEKVTPEPNPESVFQYRAEGRRDPFASLIKIREPVNASVEPDTPLQRFGLKELQLIAIVIGQNEPRAMVLAPDKKAYTLFSGVKVGRNSGKVVEITDEKVVVEERFRDFSGLLRTELKEITLPQREGE